MGKIMTKLKYLLITFIIVPLAFGHGGIDHSKESKIVEKKEIRKSVLLEINSEYLSTVKPIFKKSCFDCHSAQVNYPWYYELPVVKKIIDSDIIEAKKHLDFTQDFPFLSHESPINDLKSIKNSVISGGMPPLRYRIMHIGKKLKSSEVDSIIRWVDSSMRKLENESK